MGRTKNESDIISSRKSQLVSEICHISTNSRSRCCHGRHHHYQSSFIDWYLILQVDENAETDTIRKQYLKLALQLHPDKNTHPKAEFAFKSVSEAYSCLSDKAKKAKFDLDRKNRRSSSCVECRNGDSLNTKSSSSAGGSGSERVRNDRNFLQRMKKLNELRARLLEEVGVINNCVKSNAAAVAGGSRVYRKELPIFNPKDYLNYGYPHLNAVPSSNTMMLEREILLRFPRFKEMCDSFSFG